MKLSKLAFLGSQIIVRGSAFSTKAPACVSRQPASSLLGQETPAAIRNVSSRSRSSSTRLFSSAVGGGPTLTNIDKDEMEEIVEDYEKGGREESGYLIMDVREEHEIASTGKLSPNTITFPLQKVAQYDAFSLDEFEFEEIYGFQKPTPDETLVFSCAAGIRSVHAARFAAQHGYTKLVNYMGGAYEWFN
ncbi:unnamed protein product [Cylindrotheca closterium]|uniref:Rhodanese domain-containing protein n=1 Tax=Cylindrotheca closterium TaxID=2856 RepID=A0AAD2G598_9STRA|nr:unnamed protein product [Cylindrotheca closterium]